ncbi:protein asteroid homolog 1-like [Hypomesus transpacificus]|uniref:protein asteroid homolog 1-like n=1 Tax=Hypomesus transpacificus TaxID=137520 RepID=UPI001F07520E|nr:protein asteroid homolog 1-like [Hypomesus transpacificus]XP_046905609.1 protein asteroid homolog 1-like [Hypomesus transpacificus]
MGVRGLTSFVDDNGHILQDVSFKNSKLIIDGKNLYYLLYFDEQLDQSHGGDYESFEDLICGFIKALRENGIEPYVVVDGGSDYTDKKFETLKQRAEEKIHKAHDVSVGSKGNVLPPIAKCVFSQILTELQVPFAKSIAEADREIASLAREWNCPVLSNDSDFYIFDIPAGFLPIPHFKWKQGGLKRGIPAKHFTQERFCSRFNIDRSLLPVFASISGNDYFNLARRGVPVKWSDFSKRRGRFAHIDGLLNWLGKNKNNALSAVLKLMDDGDKVKTKQTEQAFMLSMEEYKLSPSSLGEFFRNGTPPSNIPEPVKVLPDWALLSLTQGKLSSDIIDVMLFRRVMQNSQVEDTSLPSGQLTSRSIRQILYGLLLKSPASMETGQCMVEEYDRVGLKLTSHMVKPILSGPVQNLRLDTLNKAHLPDRLTVMLETLGVTQSLTGIPPHLHLPVSVTCYWMTHAAPPPDLPLLQALLLGMVYGELCIQKKKTGISESESLVLQKFEGIVQRCPWKLDLDVAHAYSQWQACFKDSLNLNQLLCSPLLESECARLYKGTLVHPLVVELRRGESPEFILAGGPIAGPLYKALLDTVLLSQDSTTTRGAARGGTLPRQPMDDVTADLQRLAIPK